jgi:hypothetical protein
MHVELRPLSSIRPYENNPRHNDAAVDAVAASIQAFGFRQPIVVDEQSIIIVGHTRYKAALKLGLELVPVHVADGWKEGAAHQFFGPTNALDLWSIKKVNPQNMVHLTEKPVELAARAIEYSSRPGENVLDLFGGSGSTLVAAEQAGRQAFLMELDPLYCDVIVQRFEQFTGQKAQRLSS